MCVCIYTFILKKLVQIGEADPRQHTLLVFILKRSVREVGRNDRKEHMNKKLGEMSLKKNPPELSLLTKSKIGKLTQW